MKQLLHLLSIASLTFLMIGCGPLAPEEAEIKKKFIGAYCADGGSRLELYEDGTFFNSRLRKSLLSSGTLTEKCRGDYQFVYDEEKKEWRVEFTKTASQGSLASCSGSRVLWTKEGLYGDNERTVSMEDLLENKKLTLGACGGI